MTFDEFESKIQGQTETQTLDFKADMAWNISSFAKDILAMANVRDGGYIIIGIEDKTFARQGISSNNKATYSIDIMRDQMTKFADPHVDFVLEFPKDNNGTEYAVIHVLPFREIPVICLRDNPKAELYAGAIYYRNNNRRIESARVSNSYDMRDIIEHAAVKMMQKKRDLGFTVEDEVIKELDRELEGL